MIGIDVMTHGAKADGIVNACELVTGPAKQVETLSLKREDNIDDLSTAFEAAVKKVDTGDGVLVSPTCWAAAHATSRACTCAPATDSSC